MTDDQIKDYAGRLIRYPTVTYEAAEKIVREIVTECSIIKPTQSIEQLAAECVFLVIEAAKVNPVFNGLTLEDQYEQFAKPILKSITTAHANGMKDAAEIAESVAREEDVRTDGTMANPAYSVGCRNVNGEATDDVGKSNLQGKSRCRTGR